MASEPRTAEQQAEIDALRADIDRQMAAADAEG